MISPHNSHTTKGVRPSNPNGYRRGLLTNVSSAVDDATVDVHTYGYDALGRPVHRNSDSFGYNERGEVVFSRRDAEVAEYSYDDIGNLKELSSAITNLYIANTLNQYTAIQSSSALSATPREINPQYDFDGNLLTDGNLVFTYDSANRLKTVVTNGVLLLTNFYDAKSRRVKKVTPNAVTTFFYDDWNLIEERVAYVTGTASTIKYYWGKDLSGELQGAGGVGGLLYLTVSNSNSQLQLYIPCYDNNGNVTKYIDSNGNIAASYTYDAFGNLISKSGSIADFFRHRFSTKYFDTETSFYYYGYRYYMPQLMRWLNRDPIGEDGGLNLYGFCGNRIMTVFDSNGLSTYNIVDLLQDSLCEEAYQFALSKMGTAQERNAWNRYTRHDGMHSDPNIYLTAEDVKAIAESNNKVVEYIKNKRLECAEGEIFSISTSIGGNAPSPWRLAIGGVSIGITANCNGNCFSYSYKINDLYDFDIKGLRTSRDFFGEYNTILVNITQKCLNCDWRSFYHKGTYEGE